MSVDLSVVIVSFNTCQLLIDCLKHVLLATQDLLAEIIVVDNNSKDGSADRVAEEFPNIRLIKNSVNLGFAAANNEAFKIAKGRYIVLLNSDAFPQKEALKIALNKIEKSKDVGLAGALLTFPDGSWQPSARLFPSVLNAFLEISGLADKFRRSSFFGRYNRTWASPTQPCDTDWVPGAFSIFPKKILDEVGDFDERFFLYYEEIDLCKRIKKAGYRICYWPDVRVTHLGGESSKTIKELIFSPQSTQLELWRMRSMFLYYRKHKGWFGAHAIKAMELGWYRLRAFKNLFNPQKRSASETMIRLLQQAWKVTKGGTLSPPRPW